MGNFYTNYTLRGPSQQAVARAMAGRSAIVTPAQDGCVVVFDAQSDEQDSAVITELASRLSRELRCPVLAVLNHDDDIFTHRVNFEVQKLGQQHNIVQMQSTHKTRRCVARHNHFVGKKTVRLGVMF